MKTATIALRPNKVRSEEFAAPPPSGASAERTFGTFLDSLPDILVARDLLAVITTVTIPITVTVTNNGSTDVSRLRGISDSDEPLFDGLEFRVLRDRLFETLTSEEEIDESGFDVAMTTLAP